ncbi:Retrovirus-related Pol polyprotein from type-1 retrotransposable element R1 [Holothuria leucospilota]|uniref:Retrovirus-related Pol polyprotein from type-1 retrotransposable element R1 n=1 Tax=Holothuria leucospilota TaxID=206669 RepID=A0A9Q1H6P6_HOLLE|nr:Retrovirus-related Pol polyprotein from type-1 retrotransposable element R1 [Holothuria leucospilota]KAJ8034440.1 Retrovirus-related Pol polyprotein from type-1 retrotransposable element R1 [Holothuria leucospilota]
MTSLLPACSSRNMRSIERLMQTCLSNLLHWADKNGFRFLGQKLFACMRSDHCDPGPSLNGVHIPVVPQTKLHGLILYNKLNFKAHIDHLRRKCQGALNLLKVVSKMDWGADRPVLLRLYRSLLRSKLNYGWFLST